MKDVADEANEDLTLVILAEDQPTTVDPKEKKARMQECDYCGHCPCGCGG